MKDQHDKRTGNLLATPNAIRQARFAEQQRAMGRKAASTPPHNSSPHDRARPADAP